MPHASATERPYQDAGCEHTTRSAVYSVITLEENQRIIRRLLKAWPVLTARLPPPVRRRRRKPKPRRKLRRPRRKRQRAPGMRTGRRRPLIWPRRELRMRCELPPASLGASLGCSRPRIVAPRSTRPASSCTGVVLCRDPGCAETACVASVKPCECPRMGCSAGRRLRPQRAQTTPG